MTSIAFLSRSLAVMALIFPGLTLDATAAPTEADLAGIWYLEQSPPKITQPNGDTIDMRICGSAEYRPDHTERFSAELRTTMRIASEPRGHFVVSHSFYGTGQWRLSDTTLEETFDKAAVVENGVKVFYDDEEVDIDDMDEDDQKEMREAMADILAAMTPIKDEIVKGYTNGTLRTEIELLDRSRMKGRVLEPNPTNFEAMRVDTVQEICR